jgi:hypothetical protein
MEYNIGYGRVTCFATAVYEIDPVFFIFSTWLMMFLRILWIKIDLQQL